MGVGKISSTQRELKIRLLKKKTVNCCKMGSACCKEPREESDEVYETQIEDPWVERTRTTERNTVLEVNTSFPRETIDAHREQILRYIGSCDLQNGLKPQTQNHPKSI